MEIRSSGLRFLSFFKIGIFGFGDWRVLSGPLSGGRLCGRDNEIEARVRVYSGGRLMSCLIEDFYEMETGFIIIIIDLGRVYWIAKWDNFRLNGFFFKYY